MVSSGAALHPLQVRFPDEVDKPSGLSPHSFRPLKLN